MNRTSPHSDKRKRRSAMQRIALLEMILGVFILIVAARLIEIQVMRHNEFITQAEAQHFGAVRLSVRRGDILSSSSKTHTESILATNRTLSMIYIDPLEVDDPALVADALVNSLISVEIYEACKSGNTTCPRELRSFFTVAFNPLDQLVETASGFYLGVDPVVQNTVQPLELRVPLEEIQDIAEVRRLFAASIKNRIAETRVTFMPLVYGANKRQLEQASTLTIAGLYINEVDRLIYANPEEMNQLRLPSTAKQLAEISSYDAETLQRILRSRPLRYVPIMRQLSHETMVEIQQILDESYDQTIAKRTAQKDFSTRIRDPLRAIVIKPESWRYYPDEELGAQVIGFTNDEGVPQYGIERTFHPQLRGKEGTIRSASDRQGLQIVTSDQLVETAEHGDSFVLSIDRLVQNEVENIMMQALKDYQAESAQAIVMDPFTGKVIAMVNAPVFNGNDYGSVYNKEPIYIAPNLESENIVVELYHPDTNQFVVRASMNDIFTASGRTLLTTEKQQQIADIEELYNLKDVVRYYYYKGQYQRYEIFPTQEEHIWLKYINTLGVGAYLNRTTQEIYEPGSVMKAITMAVAIDQGEVVPEDLYNDTGPVEVDEFIINNALEAHYGTVNMTNCLEFSINTCMTMISNKLGRKLFHRMLTRFGFGQITGIELEDELAGELRPWKQWSRSEVATHSFGQGISATPLQMVTAFSALANGGKLMKPSILDSIIHADGTRTEIQPRMLDQVITAKTAETITAMLTSVVTRGQAKTAKVPGYKIAGKTGTSQIAGPGGRYETGPGSVRTSFAGYAPIHQPKFTILVKFDRPAGEEVFGSQTAAPTFRKIASFLLDYYGIPPDDF